MIRSLALILSLAITAASAGTHPVPMVTTVVQPKGPVTAWQLIFDNRYSGYAAPTTLGFYADLASCDRVKGQMWTTLDGSGHGGDRRVYHRFVCIEVRLP